MTYNRGNKQGDAKGLTCSGTEGRAMRAVGQARAMRGSCSERDSDQPVWMPVPARRAYRGDAIQAERVPARCWWRRFFHFERICA